MIDTKESSVSAAARLSAEEARAILTFTANGALISAGHFILNFADMLGELSEEIAELIVRPLEGMSDAESHAMDGKVAAFCRKNRAGTLEQLATARSDLYASIDSSPDELLAMLSDDLIEIARGLIDRSPTNIPRLERPISLEELLKLVAVQKTLKDKGVDPESKRFFEQLADYVHLATP